MKSQIAERSAEAQQVARVVELEKANVELRAELDAAQSKLTGVEYHEWALTSKYEDLKEDFESMGTLHNAVVREKAKVEKTVRAKLQRFQDSLRKKLAELRCDTEASVATLKCFFV
jgi:chromosome segregation ATPase